MTTVINGLLGGLVVGVVAGIVTLLSDSGPSVAAALEARATRDSSPTRWKELAIHTMYGGIAGGMLLVVELYVLQALAVPPTASEAFGVAVAWAALLFAGWAIVWRWSPFVSFNRASLGGLLVYHLVFGIAFGLWIRVTWIT